jgi:hypothetical protein
VHEFDHFPVLLAIQNVTSTLGVIGKMYVVKSALFLKECSEVKVNVVKNINSKVQIPQKTT